MDLEQLPNIGSVLAERLRTVGIYEAEDLRQIGSQEAFLRVHSVDNSGCLNMLLALEGAVQNIRWHHLPDSRKQELKRFLQENS